MKSALDYALRDAREKLRETHGKNRSPVIDAYNRAVGIPLGSPYCAAGVSACFRPFPPRPGQLIFPFSGSSQAIMAAFRERKRFSRNPDDLLRWNGALFGWTEPGGIRGHIGFVAGRLTDMAGRVVGIETVEYNTDLAGDPDGQGCYELVRRISPDGLWRVENARRSLVGTGRRLWFLDTSDIAGGRWWR